MTDGNNGMSCATGSWALAAGAGFLAFVLLIVLGEQGLVAVIFLSGLLFVVLGLIFSSIFCRKLPKIGEVVPGQDTGLRAMPPSDHKPAPKPADARPSIEKPLPVSDTPEQDTPISKPSVATAAMSETRSGPTPGAANASADAEAGAAVAPTKALAGTEELAARKGEWTYEKEGTPAEGEGTKPEMLDGPRDGTADDLKKIKGVGPKLEQLLHSMGFYHFDQIAGWTSAEIAWVDQNLEGFKGRVTRDNWVEQAGQLAGGGETEFSKRVDGGDVY